MVKLSYNIVKIARHNKQPKIFKIGYTFNVKEIYMTNNCNLTTEIFGCEGNDKGVYYQTLCSC